MRLSEIANALGAEISGSGDPEIKKVANLVTAQEGEISFLSDPHYRKALSESKASAVIVRKDDLPHLRAGACALVMPDPYVGFAKAAQLLDTTPRIATGIAQDAVVEEGAVLGDDVSLGHHAVVSKGARIGSHVQLGSGVVIGPDAVIGDYTRLYPNVSVYHDCVIGEHCLVQSGTVIGSDGFGYANEKGVWVKIPQTGRVVIGSFVEIGACTCIDRGAIDDTVIEDNVIIDNLCQVAHNVHIGTGTAVAGGTTFAGSCKIGRYCIIGGTSVFNGHITICDGVTISGMCMVMRSIDKPGIYSSGIPAQPNREWRLTASRTLHINEMYHKLEELAAKVAKLESARQ
ncbi:MAG: UDP-3-O-(3-hydroxymyristoyl)glucosamine N-acyltransferase [Succinivibrio sp.]|jgi:UDP-3-O-[3-hydroxymyristoyl] glucosamine N-acyltransferase|nr:UDP-3-O-(3-hydroxymyristoyl)glucosamine N-acyltransferase [Succinivibrio sp.]